jgi:hypothetical protein
VTLTAYSVNFGGDNSIETRLLLDNVRVNAVSVVAEPSALVLLLLGTIVASRIGNKFGQH